jgi:D-methionine transport system substrate-binding protein
MRLIYIILFSISFLFSCHQSPSNEIRIGTITGPETDVLLVAKKIAEEKYHLNVKIIEFNDYNLPNEALADGSLDANIYQHLPYLKAAMKAHNYPFKALGKTFIYPMAIYSQKWSTLYTIPSHALVAIPNDPSNETRALVLLDEAGLITLKNKQTAGLSDIVNNTKKLRFKELDAAQLPRVLSDVDLAVINTTYAVPAGLSPTQDSLYKEDKHSEYANLMVINNNTQKMEQLGNLLKALQTKEVQEAATQLFGDAAIPAW